YRVRHAGAERVRGGVADDRCLAAARRGGRRVRGAVLPGPVGGGPAVAALAAVVAGAAPARRVAGRRHGRAPPAAGRGDRRRRGGPGLRTAVARGAGPAVRAL